VIEEARDRGVGALVVRTLMHGFPTEIVWITTDLPGWFERFGFVRATDAETPPVLTEKIAKICVRNGVVAMRARRR
jgi:N-acetylglutamate synthase-like GNAT family acetyltransferase